MTAPVIETERLVLRPHRMDDMETFWAFYQTDRAKHLGRPKHRTHLFYGLSSEVVSWDWMGHGAWAIDTADGDFIGQVSITQPPHFPEREIGWMVFDGHEGQGIAFEAASAALEWAWSQEYKTLVSYITHDNARSRVLATRLGASLDPDAQLPEGDNEDEVCVYRHRRRADA